MIFIVTGGIGSGKSSIINELKKHEDFKNAGFINIDTLVADIYEMLNGGKIIAGNGHFVTALLELRDFLIDEFKTTDKREISKIVFKDNTNKTKAKRKMLEDAFINAIGYLFSSTMYEHDSHGSDVVVEFPTYFEKKMDIDHDAIISIVVSKDTQIQRALSRGDSQESINAKLNAQVDNLYREEHSDLCVNNEKDLDSSVDQIVHFVRMKKNPNYKHAITAGSFDPITTGHLWMIKKSLMVCDHLTILVANNSAKKHLFNIDIRKNLVSSSLKEYLTQSELDKVSVRILDSKETTAAAADLLNAKLIIRGIRNQTDFAYENELSLVNRSMNSNIETIYLIPPRELTEVSSSLVRNLLNLNGWEKFVKTYVSQSVLEELKLNIR